jgi:hypothetical protein
MMVERRERVSRGKNWIWGVLHASNFDNWTTLSILIRGWHISQNGVPANTCPFPQYCYWVRHWVRFTNTVAIISYGCCRIASLWNFGFNMPF